MRKKIDTLCSSLVIGVVSRGVGLLVVPIPDQQTFIIATKIPDMLTTKIPDMVTTKIPDVIMAKIPDMGTTKIPVS